MSTPLTFTTEADLTKLKAIDGKDTIYTDSRTPGLRVRVSARTGRKTFILEYRRQGTDQQLQGPTKKALKAVSSLKEARLCAAELRTALSRGIDPYAPAKQSPPPTEKITVRFIAKQYHEIKKPSAADWRSIERAILPTFGDMDVTEVKTHHISAWHSSFTKKSAIRDELRKVIGWEYVPAPHQADRMLDTFKAMMNWAERQELKARHTNPCEFVERNYSQLDTERNYEWSDEELIRLSETLRKYEQEADQAYKMGNHMVAIRRPDGTVIEHLPGLWSILAIRFLIITGVRKSEALCLRWDQIKEDRRVIEWVRNSRRRETKAIGGGQRVMLRAITEPLAELLQKLKVIRIVGNPYVFVGEDRRGRLTEITRVWYRIRDDAKLIKADGERPRLHDLRHFYGQMAADAGLHEKQIMALMGHSTTRMSARYSKYGSGARSGLAESVARRISEKLPSS